MPVAASWPNAGCACRRCVGAGRRHGLRSFSGVCRACGQGPLAAAGVLCLAWVYERTFAISTGATSRRCCGAPFRPRRLLPVILHSGQPAGPRFPPPLDAPSRRPSAPPHPRRLATKRTSPSFAVEGLLSPKGRKPLRSRAKQVWYREALDACCARAHRSRRRDRFNRVNLRMARPFQSAGQLYWNSERPAALVKPAAWNRCLWRMLSRCGVLGREIAVFRSWAIRTSGCSFAGRHVYRSEPQRLAADIVRLYQSTAPLTCAVETKGDNFAFNERVHCAQPHLRARTMSPAYAIPAGWTGAGHGANRRFRSRLPANLFP